MTLPNGWQWASLEEVIGDDAPIVYGIIQAGPEVANGIPYIRPTELVDGRIDVSSLKRTSIEIAAKYSRSILKAGDIILAIVGTIGKVAIVPPELEGANITQSSARLRPPSFMPPAYLAAALQSPQLREQFDRMEFGVAVRRLNIAHVRALRIPVAPVNEQHRIVARLDAILEQTRAARARLGRVPALLDRLKRSVLAAAFRGDLTADWRAANPDVEPASALLNRIGAEHRRRWEDARRTKGRTGNSSYKQPASANSDHMPKLPASWMWTRAEEICEFITKGTTPAAAKMSSDAGVPFIKVYNLTFDGRLDFTVDPTFVDVATHQGELSRSRVFPGDVLMNIVGPPLGKVSLVPGTFPEWNINQAIAVFRPLRGLLGRYLCSVLMYLGADHATIARAKATSGQLNLTLEICRDLAIPLPPEAEQEELVRRLDVALQAVVALECAARSALSRTEALERASLAKAFRGELVDQDPNDEPASSLIERVRAMGADKEKSARVARSSRSAVRLKSSELRRRA